MTEKNPLEGREANVKRSLTINGPLKLNARARLPQAKVDWSLDWKHTKHLALLLNFFYRRETER